MHRVGSTAMESLAAYSDSEEDEEQSPFGTRRRRASEVGESPQRRLERMSTTDTLPEAPPSQNNTPSPRAQSPQSDKQMWISPEGDSPQPEQSLKEPPPPARPRFFQSPSPSSSTEQTPLNAAPKLTNNPSSMSLVSYGAEDDEDERQNEIRTDSAAEVINESSERRESSEEREKTETKGDEAEQLDVHAYAYLGEALEGGVATPQSAGSESPSATVTTDQPDTVTTDASIPPAPEAKCSPELLETFANYFKRKAAGYDFNYESQKRKDFRNPSMYEKLIDHFGIDEIGSNFPKNLFDPHGFKPGDFYDKLAEAQKIAMDRLDKERHGKGEIKKETAASVDRKSRKSKWDIPTGGSGPRLDTKKAKV